MDAPFGHPQDLPAPPWRGLRHRLLSHATELSSAGDAPAAAVLRALVESWWRDQEQWNAAARELLRANHEINNALVGVCGNAQLLLMSSIGQQPKVRERLQVMMRESQRIERAAQRLQSLKVALEAEGGTPHGHGAAHAA